jgi:glycosyltransferase involved in cell wall biosynthesis
VRILFSLLDAQIGGGQRVALRVARELSARGHQLGVVVPACGPATETFDELGSRIHEADIGSLRGTSDVFPLGTALRRYDVLYSHTSIPGQLLGDLASQLTRRAHVIHQHTVARVSPSPTTGALHRLMYKATVANRPIIAVAPHVRRSVLALGARPDHVTLVPNGVDIDELSRLSRAAKPRSALRVGMLARFDPQKGMDSFLRAAAQTHQPGVDFVIGASGESYRAHEIEVRDRARSLGVDIVDPGNEGSAFLAELDIVVLPSLGVEGSPLTLLEAMGLGKPVVASDVEGIGSIPGIADAVLLVPPGDVRAMAAAISCVVDDPAAGKPMGARARALVRSRSRADTAARTAADFVEGSAG